jgi:hypothetical protein
MKKSLYLLVWLFFYLNGLAQKGELPNGSFENWPDDFAPAEYGAFQAPQAQYKELRTVFKSDDAHAGKYSVRLKNASINEMMQKMGVKLPAGFSIPETIIPAGIWHCSGNCKMPPRGRQGLERAKFPVSYRYKTVCGYYKGKLAGGDKLFVSVAMFKGNNVMGGSDAGTIQQAFIVESTDTWKKFEIPITYLANDKSATPDGMSLEISIVGAGFPQNAFAGGTGGFVHLGTDVLIDNVHFCEGKADLLVFNPKVLNEKSTPIVHNDTSSTASNTANASNGTHELVPDNEQMNPGAQTFVNLDNDDNDVLFDHNPRNLSALDTHVEGGDDELIQVVLKIKPDILSTTAHLENATATLTALTGRANIQVWNAASKGELLTLPKVFNVKNDFTEREGEFLVKKVWIEGISAHTQQQGTVLQLTYSEDPTFEEKFAITVIGIEKIEWIGRNNSVSHDNNLDRDQNHRNPSDQRVDLPEGECNGLRGTYTLKPEGVRIFPDRRVLNGFVLDEKPRNIVDVKVKLSVKPVKPVKLYFKSFDVDDPTATGINQPPKGDPTYQYWVDNDTKNTDNRGAVGNAPNKNAGKFQDEDQTGILEVEFSEIEKTFPFEVTMQPGDNFRIVGSCDKDFIATLHNNDAELHKGANDDEKTENKQRIVSPYVLKNNPEDPKLAEICLPDSYASKTLTVWRFLNVEVDYMEEIKEGTIAGTIAKVLPNKPVQGQTTLVLVENITTELKKITNVSVDDGTNSKITGNGLKDYFQEGRITIKLPGQIGNTLSMTYEVLYNTNQDTGSDEIIVQGVVPDAAKEQTYALQNDDEKLGFTVGTSLKTAIAGRKHVTELEGKCLAETTYSGAYIVPDFKSINTPALNPTPTVPFVRNVKKYEYDDNALLENYRFDNQGLQKYDDFWTVYLLFAFKGTTYEDGDPDALDSRGREIPNTLGESVISGITDKQRIGAHIFLEGVLERNNGRYFAMTNNGRGEIDCICHELAHLFGAEHEDSGVMAFPDGIGQYFSPRTKARLREAKRPGPR